MGFLILVRCHLYIELGPRCYGTDIKDHDRLMDRQTDRWAEFNLPPNEVRVCVGVSQSVLKSPQHTYIWMERYSYELLKLILHEKHILNWTANIMNASKAIIQMGPGHWQAQHWRTVATVKSLQSSVTFKGQISLVMAFTSLQKNTMFVMTCQNIVLFPCIADLGRLFLSLIEFLTIHFGPIWEFLNNQRAS